jgi:hypothetical protein
MVGVGEAVPDQHRADSLNTGWVKVPVKFPALAVVAQLRIKMEWSLWDSNPNAIPMGAEVSAGATVTFPKRLTRVHGKSLEQSRCVQHQ